MFSLTVVTLLLVARIDKFIRFLPLQNIVIMSHFKKNSFDDDPDTETKKKRFLMICVIFQSILLLFFHYLFGQSLIFRGVRLVNNCVPDNFHTLQMI